MSEWQPIETAPKDGRPIIAAVPTGALVAGQTHWRGIIFWVSKPGWWLDRGRGEPLTREPSHWMPLPESPAVYTESPAE